LINSEAFSSGRIATRKISGSDLSAANMVVVDIKVTIAKRIVEKNLFIFRK
jgi:hypothetical protein